jgi:glycosyltransferase involved in cell wall biosynthesis
MNLGKSFSKNKLLSKFLYNKADCLVSVSKAIEEEIKKVYRLTNVKTIYNPYKKETILRDEIVFERDAYILFFGRLDEESKDVSFLINAYKNSSLPSKGIRLFLLGNGPDKFKLEQLVLKLQMEKIIIFIEHSHNPFPYVRKAIFTVLTSNFEGYPMSIIESLVCETPVVSVDCESGPSEIIINNYNGLLVEKSLDIYTAALDKMISDKELLATCKKNSLKSVQHLSYEYIKKEWEQLINSI